MGKLVLHPTSLHRGSAQSLALSGGVATELGTHCGSRSRANDTIDPEAPRQFRYPPRCTTIRAIVDIASTSVVTNRPTLYLNE